MMWRSSGMIDPATRPNATLSTRLARMASLLLSGAILSGAPDARAEDLKRDLRGFSLGMSKDEAARIARSQCNNFGKVSFHGGMRAEEFFASSSENGKLFSCRFQDGSIVNYALTPRTGKVYKLSGVFLSQMTCPELLDFILEEFKVGDKYSKYHPKPKADRTCQGWSWQAGPSYDLKVWINEPDATRFNVSLMDSEIVRENESPTEDPEKQSGVRPRL
jgi:hypothetical protein